MEPTEAAHELELVRSILDRTQRRLDPHAFHFVGWGAVVLVWFPLENYLQMQHDSGHETGVWPLVVMIAAITTGILVGVIGEARLNKRGAEPDDTIFSRKVGLAVWGSIGPAALLTIVGPMLGIIPGERMAIVWGFAYAVLAYTMGILYSREYLWAGVFIFVGAVAAMAVPEYDGFILGPAMGLGLLVPGLLTERRVRARREADQRVAAA